MCMHLCIPKQNTVVARTKTDNCLATIFITWTESMEIFYKNCVSDIISIIFTKSQNKDRHFSANAI